MSNTILVTGANGQLGSELRDIAPNFPQYSFLFVGRDELDITDERSVNELFAGNAFYACINCAAYTAVDKAEAEQDAAFAANAKAVGILAKASAGSGTKFIHISTDYVFDGQGQEPYLESQPTSPVNFYGQTKLAGEEAAIKENPESLIIRTSWVYSHHGKNFVKTMLRLMSERESIGVVADQLGSPTYAADLAEAIMIILSSDNFQPGIYHYSNQGIISWHQFAEAIKEISGSSCTVNAIKTTDYPTPAARPAYSAFNTQKIRNSYGIEIPAWRNSLEKCIGKMYN